MKQEVMISFIVPMYNVERFIVECINSILSQTYKTIEIILVNDGSTDNTLEICKKFEREANVKLLNQDNKGVSSARNEGLKHSIGEYIVFVDADDYVSDILAEHIVRFGAECIDFIIFNNFENKRNIDNYTRASIKELQLATLGWKNSINVNFLASPWCKAYKRKIIMNNDIIFNERLRIGEDLLFNLEYEECISNFIIINKEVYFYRDNAESVTKKFLKDFVDIDLRYQIECNKFSVKYKKDEEFNQAIALGTLKGLTIAVKRYFGNFENNNYVIENYNSMKKMAAYPVYKNSINNYLKINNKHLMINEKLILKLLKKQSTIWLLAVIIKSRKQFYKLFGINKLRNRRKNV